MCQVRPLSELLGLVSRNELPFDEYDLDGFESFLNQQDNVRNVAVRESSITFWCFFQNRWNLEHLKAQPLIETGKLDRTPHLAHLYIIFTKGDPTGFSKRFGAFLRGEMEGGSGSLKMLRRMTEKCACCGLPDHHPILGDFTVEHKVPASLGGSSFIENLEVVHKGCNSLLDRYDLESKDLLKEAMKLYSDEIDTWMFRSTKHRIRELRRKIMDKCGLTPNMLLTAKRTVS